MAFLWRGEIDASDDVPSRGTKRQVREAIILGRCDHDKRGQSNGDFMLVVEETKVTKSYR